MTTWDRRRTNPPSGGTTAPIYSPSLLSTLPPALPTRTRGPNDVRKICVPILFPSVSPLTLTVLQTNLIPSAPGSAYLELSPSPAETANHSPLARSSTLKLSATVHGPRALPRTAPYSSTLQVTCTVKFAPFATRHRRGYVRDAVERDLAAQLESALRASVIGTRWPKSGAEVVVTVLEGAEERTGCGGSGDAGDGSGAELGEGTFARMAVLAGCVSVAGTALAGAGIDGVDLVSGGVAALVRRSSGTRRDDGGPTRSIPHDDKYDILLDPDFAEHSPAHLVAACGVAYLHSRDEVAGLWMVGEIPVGSGARDAGAEERKQTPQTPGQGGKDTAEARAEAWDRLLEGAVHAAGMSGQVVRAAVLGELG